MDGGMDRQTDRQTDRQIDSQLGRQIDRQVGRCFTYQSANRILVHFGASKPASTIFSTSESMACQCLHLKTIYAQAVIMSFWRETDCLLFYFRINVHPSLSAFVYQPSRLVNSNNANLFISKPTHFGTASYAQGRQITGILKLLALRGLQSANMTLRCEPSESQPLGLSEQSPLVRWEFPDRPTVHH